MTAPTEAEINSSRRRFVLGGLGAAFASGVTLGGGTRSADHPRGKRRMIGMNLISWDPGTNNDPGSWERAVHQISSLGIRRITVVGYRMVGRETGYIGRGRHNSEPGPSHRAMAAAMNAARSLGMDVSLKPFIEIDNPHGEGNVWRGLLNFKEQKLGEFFREYEHYIVEMANLARDCEANRFYIGSELAALTRNEKARAHWQQLIAKCRDAYSGNQWQLTYAANFDEYEHITFWDQLDEIGIDAYFPLVRDKGVDPMVDKLVASWVEILSQLRQFAEERGRRILFSEWGVVPLHGTTTAPFEWKPSRRFDYREALNAYKATLIALSAADNYWLSGVDFWHWSMSPHDESNYRIEPNSDIAQLLRRFSLNGKRAD